MRCDVEILRAAHLDNHATAFCWWSAIYEEPILVVYQKLERDDPD